MAKKDTGYPNGASSSVAKRGKMTSAGRVNGPMKGNAGVPDTGRHMIGFASTSKSGGHSADHSGKIC